MEKKLNTHVLDVEKIKKAIVDDNIRVISFDIFDTLLVRAVLSPVDIFEHIERKFNMPGFKDNRIIAGQCAGKNCTLLEIYDYLTTTGGYSKEKGQLLFTEEMNMEKTLLYRRESIFKLYEYAVHYGKRIIAISDMYLDSSFISEILTQNGYNKIDSIYISCDEEARKDEGHLYDVVCKKENVLPNSIIHIGDNYYSDYVVPKRKKIRSFWYPSCVEIASSCKVGINRLININDIQDVNAKIVYGFAINKCFDNIKSFHLNNPLNNSEIFSAFILFPVLFHILSFLTYSKGIQKDYESIYYASRDGYLPLSVYETIAKKNNLINGIYLYASRKSYQYVIYDSASDRVLKEKYGEDYSFEDYIDSLIYDDDTRKKVKAQFSERELHIPVEKEKLKIANMLNDSPLITEFFCQARKKTAAYYHNIFEKTNDRAIVFDCGYSGSISVAVEKATGIKMDKVYLWEEPLNKERDSLIETISHVLIGNERPFWNDTLFETLLSSVEGSCVGFTEKDGDIVPVFYNDPIDSESKEIIEKIQAFAKGCCEEIIDLMGDYRDDFLIHNGNSVVDNTYKMFKYVSHNNLGILNQIKFKDKYIYNLDYSFGSVISTHNMSIDHVFVKAKHIVFGQKKA